MQSPAISNTSNVAPAQKNGAKATDGNPSDGVFGQMLSQQIADTRPAATADSAHQANKSANKPEKAESADKAKTAEAKPAAENNEKAAATEPADGKQASAGPDTAVPTATELLALAASGMLNAQSATTETEAVADAAGGLSNLSGKGKRLTGLENALQQARTNAAVDTSEFRDAIDGAGKQQSAAGRDGLTGLPNALASADGKAFDKLTELAASAKMQDSPALSGTVTQLQQSGLDISKAATGIPTDRLTPQVGTPAWDQALGQKVVWMVAGTQQSASLTLNPPDLGPLQVVLNVSNGQTDASFYAAQPEVRQALEAALPKLRDMMNDAGVELGQTTVSAGMPDQHNQPGEQSAHQSSRGGSHGTTQGETAAPAAQATRVISGQGLVDTFA